MNDADQPYEQLRMRYAGSLARKHDDLARAWQVFAKKPGDAAARRGLHAQIHRLSGSAASYGYENLGALAHRFDELLSQPDPRASALMQAPADFAPVLDAPMQALLGALVEATALAMKNPPAIP